MEHKLDANEGPDGRRLSIGVLVLNYNTWELALRALDAAIRLDSDAVQEFILYDDGSTTPPPPVFDPRIRFIRGGVNRGFAGALNAAFAQMNSAIVVLFDSDAYPLTPFAARVRERFETEFQLGQIGFFTEDRNGSRTESYFSEPSKWSLLLGQRLYTCFPFKARMSNLCVITGCMATRSQAHVQVGGFDENLEFLDVDVDYSMRLRQSGWKVIIEPSVKVFHEGGGTPQLQRHRVLRFYKSRWYLLRKHGQITHAGVARAFVLTRLIIERAVLTVFGNLLFRTPDIAADKLLGRRELISYCRKYYR